MRQTTRSRHVNLHRHWETELCLICAASREELPARIDQLDAFLAQSGDASLTDIAFSLGKSWQPSDSTLAIVASSVDDLREKTAASRKRLIKSDCMRIKARNGIFFFDDSIRMKGKLAFLFPGEGSQYTNMLLDLCLHFPEVRREFDLVDRACQAAGGDFVPSRHIFPSWADGDTTDAALWEMAAAIESVSAADMALRQLFRELGIVPDAVVGHSSGEFVALDSAGVLRFESEEEEVGFIRDGYVQLKKLISRTDIPEGVLLTVGGVDRGVIDEMLGMYPDRLLTAIENCPHQYVLCAVPELAGEIASQLSGKYAMVVPLPFRRPYHTRWFESTLDGLRDLFRRYRLRSPDTDIYSCASAERFPADTAEIERLCVGQWAQPVRFEKTVERMHEDGIRFFVEVGPRGNLTSFVNDILSDKPCVAVAANRIRRSGITQLQHALALLAAHGVFMKPDFLYARRDPQLLDFASRAKPESESRSMTMTLSPVLLPSMSAGEIPPRRSTTVAGTGSVASAASDGDPVMRAYFDNMEQFFAIQRQVASRFSGMPGLSEERPAASSPVAPPVREGPMLGRIVEHRPGESLVAVKTFDVEEEVFLRDHAFPGTVVSLEDSALSGLPVMPLTMSLEVVSEAAAALIPGRVVVALKDVRATRWISFEEREQTVRITARVLSSGDRPTIRVEIRDADGTDKMAAYRPSLVEATVVLAEHYESRQDTTRLELDNEKACNWNTRSIYPEYLFHGPTLQGIASMTRWAEEGMEGSVRVMPRSGLLRSDASPAFAIDPILLDSVGAVLYIWLDCEGSRKKKVVVLPYRVKEIRFFGPLQPENTVLKTTLRKVSLTDMAAEVDIRAVDDEGRVVIEMLSWESRTFAVTPALHGVFHTPTSSHVSDVCEIPGLDSQSPDGPVCCISSSVSAEFLRSSHGVWETMLAYSVFDEAGRGQWKGMEGDEKRRIQWLLGRTVAKEAVRRFLVKRHDLQTASPDVKITVDENGKPLAGGTWEEKIRGGLEISIAHAGDVAVAVAGPASAGALGIDVEPGGQMNADLLQEAFSGSEQDLLRRLSRDGSEWALRLWCAKEAAAKAIGTGVSFDPRDIMAVRADNETGEVEMELQGGRIPEAVKGEGLRLGVATFLRDGAVLAFTRLHPDLTEHKRE